MEAFSTIMNLLVRLSQLAVMLRNHVHTNEDRSRTLEIVALILSLYEGGEGVKSLVENSASLVPTQHHLTASVMPQSYSFPSNYNFDLAVHYFTYRSLLCGLIQSFYYSLPSKELDDVSRCIDLATVQREDEITSRNIAMCVEYSQGSPAAPCIPLRFNTALKHAYGS